MRDPRIDPRAGDELKLQCGLRVRVDSTDGQHVDWTVRQRDRADYANSWTLTAWRSTVAHGAIVTRYAEEPAHADRD